MIEQISKYLRDTRLGNKSTALVLKAVAERFGGQCVGHYVKIGDTEYLIRRDPDNTDCGFEIREMDWKHGNDWRFFYPY